MSPKRPDLPAGAIRPRSDPPTLDEAIFAAQGLAHDLEGQTEIASMLMGLPRDQVRESILSSPPRPMPRMPRMMADLPGSSRPAPSPKPRDVGDRRVTVERRPPRFPAGG